MNNVKKLAVTAMLFAVGMVLPFFIGQIPAIGKMLFRCIFRYCSADLLSDGSMER